jgi:uncharacterized protein
VIDHGAAGPGSVGARSVAPDQSDAPRRRSAAIDIGVVATCVSTLGIFCVADGSPSWRIVRLVVMVGVGVAIVSRIRAHRGSPGRGVGIALIALGVVSVSAGVALGAHRVSVAGVDVIGLVGYLAFGAGLVAVVTGIRRVTSGLRWWWHVSVDIALVVVVVVAVSVVAPALLATNVPPTPNRGALGDVGLAGEDVRYADVQGTELAAWYVPARNGAIVIMRHGASANRSQSLRHAKVLVAHGYGVLITDARGHGESGGTAMDFGWNGDADIAAAVEFLKRRVRDEPTRIAILGLSMGAEEAIGAAADIGGIDAVVAEGATARTDADKEWLAEAFGIRGSIQVGLERVQYALTAALSGVSRPLSLADAVADMGSTPLLLIAAGTIADEATVAERLAERSPASSVVWVVPEAGHIGALGAEPRLWEDTVVGFLDSALGVG